MFIIRMSGGCVHQPLDVRVFLVSPFLGFRHTSLVPKLVSPRPFDAANDGVIFDIAFQANQPYMLFAYHLQV